MKNKFKITDIGIGALFTLFFISLGVVIVINFRAFYEWEIGWLGIDVSSGLSKEVIMENYNALIDYCSPFFNGPLAFPTLTASESGIVHFEEVKRIFIFFYWMIPVTGILLTGIIIYKRKKQDFSYLLISSLTCIILPIVVSLACMINFDKTFVLFHQLFFNNDYWIFDPTTDPIITVLPEEFFLHCAILIVVIVVLGSITLFGFSRKLKQRV